MALLIGVDEAGYGPNLGPLVIAATVWEVTDCGIRNAECGIKKRDSAFRIPHSEFAPPDLYKLLRRAVTRVPDGKRVAIADSKALYKPDIGLVHLERGVLSAMHCARVAGVGAQRSPQRVSNNGHPHPSPPPRMGEGDRASWSVLVETLAADPQARERELPWHDGFDCNVPCAAEGGDLTTACERLTRTMDSARVWLRAVRARLVFPGEFNELVETYGNKAAALSEVTMRLVREVTDNCGMRNAECGMQASNSAIRIPQSEFPSPLVVCDKHGGRNYYAALVQQHFPESWVEVLHESRAASWYRTSGDTPLEFCFRMEGEAFLPAALASMTAKYMRELSMRAFNEFWCARIPELRPTAGYPGDSRRFWKAIVPEQRRLGIADRLLWRER